MTRAAILSLLAWNIAHAEQFLYFPFGESHAITCSFCCPDYPIKNVCHSGTDYRASDGTPVFAAAQGVVELVVNGYPAGFRKKGGFGNHVRIRHPNGYLTIYAHLARDSITVQEGGMVVVGQLIALSDNSGFSLGSHLHFEVRNSQGQKVNPYGQNPSYPNCGTNPLWATCPPTPYVMPPAPDAAVPDGPVIWPDGAVFPDASAQSDSSVPSDVGLDGPAPVPDAALLDGPLPPAPDAALPAPDAGISDPCIGITCAIPPNPYCVDAWVLRTHTAPGTCSQSVCAYPYFETSCSEGCQNGECLSNPCTGVICENPPAAYCLNSTTRRTYASQGICVDGTCSYNTVDAVCTDGNACTADSCANGACAYLAMVPCCGNSACEGSETVCNCAADCAPWCGDGCCSGVETCANCEDDCACSLPAVCLNATESCGADSTPTTTSYRFVNLCTSAHWQSIGESCYPGASGPTQGCGGCGLTTVNSGCSSATCWDRELSFPTYLLEPGYGQFSQIFHCFESGANSYSRTGCNSYGDPVSIGWIADESVGEWTRPLYLCQWFTGIVTEQFFSWNCSQEAGGGNPVTTLNPSPYGYVPW